MNTVRRLSFAMLATLVAVSLTDRSEASPVTTQLYFTDQGTGTIDTYNVGTSTLSTFAADANYAAGISPDPTGGFYVANLATGQLEQYNPSGGTPVGPSLGFGIFGTAVSPLNGDIVVGNYFTTNTLAQVTPGGSVSAFTTNVIKNAQGLAFDSAGNLYVGEFFNGDVIKIATNGTASVFATGLSEPAGLAFDAAGNLYVANGNTNIITKITSAGGTGTVFYKGALLNDPRGLTVDGSGNLYVANEGFGVGTNTIAELYAAGGNTGTVLVSGLGNPEFVALPEPSTYAFMAAGMAGLLAFRRRRA